VERGVALVRVGCLGTLLGPEESGAGRDGCPGAGLVGLLVLDSWIVDASIARTAAPVHSVVVECVWWGCFCVGVCFCSVCLCSIE